MNARKFTQRTVFTALTGLALGVAATSAEAATIEYQFFPDQNTPNLNPWNTQLDVDATTASVVTDTGLKVVDNQDDGGGAQVPLFLDDDTSTGVSSGDTDWQVRSRLRMDAFGGSSATRAGFIAGLDDGNKAARFGVRFSGTESVVVGVANGPGELQNSDPGDLLTFSRGSFLDIVMSFDSTAQQLTLEVTGEDGGTTTKSTTVAYSDLTNFTANRLIWGGGASPTTSETLVQGVTFGIGEAAPAITPIPEPASLAMGLVGFGALALRRRRRA